MSRDFFFNTFISVQKIELSVGVLYKVQRDLEHGEVFNHCCVDHAHSASYDGKRR